MSTDWKDINEPIEIRIAKGRPNDRLWHLAAWNDGGMVRASLLHGGEGIPNSLSNLQSKAQFPNKAVKGWQWEVIAFAEAGLGKVVEVR